MPVWALRLNSFDVMEDEEASGAEERAVPVESGVPAESPDTPQPARGSRRKVLRRMRRRSVIRCRETCIYHRPFY